VWVWLVGMGKVSTDFQAGSRRGPPPLGLLVAPAELADAGLVRKDWAPGRIRGGRRGGRAALEVGRAGVEALLELVGVGSWAVEAPMQRPSWRIVEEDVECRGGCRGFLLDSVSGRVWRWLPQSSGWERRRSPVGIRCDADEDGLPRETSPLNHRRGGAPPSWLEG